MNKFASFFLTAAMLTGCGGGGGGGPSTLSYTGAADPVAITADNAQSLALASVEASSQMIAESQSGGSSLPFSVAINNDSASTMKSKISEIGLMLLKNNRDGQFPAGVVITSDELNTQLANIGFGAMYCGGSVDISDSIYSSSSQGSGTITYNNLCIINFDGNGNDAIFSGSIQISYGDGSSTTTYSNIAITVNGVVEMSANGSESCTWDPGTFYNNYVCTTTSYYKGGDGKTYQVVDADVTGSDTFGWDVNATFYHPDYGSVTVVATGLKFVCDNGHPSAGTILITGTGGTSVTMTFSDCNTYNGSYTLDGGASTTGISGW